MGWPFRNKEKERCYRQISAASQHFVTGIEGSVERLVGLQVLVMDKWHSEWRNEWVASVKKHAESCARLESDLAIAARYITQLEEIDEKARSEGLDEEVMQDLMRYSGDLRKINYEHIASLKLKLCVDRELLNTAREILAEFDAMYGRPNPEVCCTGFNNSGQRP